MPTKGQKLSEESIEKMKKAKLNRISSQYNWVIAEPYLDVEIKNGSVKRINKYITLREFKENIEKGISSIDMDRDGISRKIVQFFSNFVQGKIELTKEQFEKDYWNGKSLDEISKEYKIPREDITQLRQLYNIKRKGATYINRKKTEVPLTQRQKEILYGSLMGDAKRQHTEWLSSAGFGHCEAQKDYLMWKYIEFSNIVSENSLRFNEDIDKRRGNRTAGYRFYTMANSDVEIILTQFYGGGKKIITQEILNNLTSLSVAVWMMDDGTVDWKYRMRKENKWGISPEIKICTDSFSDEECSLIIEWFKNKYNIDSHIRYHNKGKFPRVVIKSTSVQDFFKLIEPHIIPSMRYKIDYEAWKKSR